MLSSNVCLSAAILSIQVLAGDWQVVPSPSIIQSQFSGPARPDGSSRRLVPDQQLNARVSQDVNPLRLDIKRKDRGRLRSIRVGSYSLVFLRLHLTNRSSCSCI